jgi:hypothetical protein
MVAIMKKVMLIFENLNGYVQIDRNLKRGLSERHSSRAKKKRGKRNIRFSGQMSLSVQEMLKMYLKRTIFPKWYGEAYIQVKNFVKDNVLITS